MKVFGEIENRCLDFLVDWMRVGVGRVAQGDNMDFMATFFQGSDFLGDEGFRQPRITL